MDLNPAIQSWVCCQVGAREHYAVPRALHYHRVLGHLLTDTWVRPVNPIGLLKRNLRERFHPSLAGAPVKAWNLGLVAFEINARARKLSGWPLILARNKWFQKRVVQELNAEMLKAETDPGRSRVPGSQPSTLNPQPVLFSYSYAALEPFRWARQRGWKTILGQIDPGPAEERIVAGLHSQFPQYAGAWQPAPPAYWRAWREECLLASVIVVNSEWSRQALIEEGVPEAKIAVVPLAYEIPPESQGFERVYPPAFTPERPLRVLFLGQVCLRKGAWEIFRAAALLGDQPVEFWLVGPLLLDIPPELPGRHLVRCIGPVPRGQAAEWYRRADVFLFPTRSDGFGLTQLEAQAWRLPVITTRFCGEVVEHGRNGLILERVDGPTIADTVRSLVGSPKRLAELSGSARVTSRFSLTNIAQALSAAAGPLIHNA
jgi:glycosyltransferase involved in cell wall biosynthesis